MKKGAQEEAELNNKAGTAWSHSYLNQKPWHPLSYPNQRKKWIAEQTHLQRERKAEEVAREFAQEQEFFRQAATLSKREQEKAEAMKALSFMYMRPPGYNAESARAAEVADERRKLGIDDADSQPLSEDREGTGDDVQPEKKKARVKDIYGRPVPTEEEFPALKNAPKLETGALARPKPFGVEIRNVKCARCGKFGHQSGDRECTMKDTIMPSEQARLIRDDPLTAMMANTNGNKWELKQQPGGMSPPRGGFKADDPNQQIIPDDIYDEYGGFLAGGDGFADMIASLSRDQLKKEKKKKKKKEKKKKKKRKSSSTSDSDRSGSDSDRNSRRRHSGKVDFQSSRNSKESTRKTDRGSRKSHRDGKDEESKRRKEERRTTEAEADTSGSDSDKAGRERHRDDHHSSRGSRYEESENHHRKHRHHD